MSTFNRRQFATTASLAALASSVSARGLLGGERPKIENPRATDGDARFEPNWEERFQVTVGTDKGDLIGKDDKVLQAAVDYVHRRGGGTVKILPGTFTLRNAVVLPSDLRVIGSGADTIITRTASETIPLAADSDWYDQEITMKQSGNFRVGDGIALTAKNADTGENVVIKRTLMARSGNRYKLNEGLRKNLWMSGKPECSSLFPLFTSDYTADVWVENLTLDGNKNNVANFNGNYGGCIFLQDCNRYTLRKITTRNYNGDGISFQICHDVVVDECHSHDNANLGVHPGSGSQRPVIRNCRLERNNLGLFWCWGVKFGLAENNVMTGNRSYGISIGHCDTDNIMRNNRILNSGKVGILFRDDSRGMDFWANRNRVENNEIVNSGGESGIAIDITGKTKDIHLEENVIRETRSPQRRTGIRIGPSVGRVQLVKNTIEGFQEYIRDQRTVDRDG